jgi:excisionase family DNA binding protein
MTRRDLESMAVPDAQSAWLTTGEVAALLRVHPKHVYRLLQQGMPARRVGGQWRFSRAAIERWAERRGTASRADADGGQSVQAPLSPIAVAIEPDEVSDAVVAVLGASLGTEPAVERTTARRALDMLAAGAVVAAVVRRDEKWTPAPATVHIGLGARKTASPRASSPALPGPDATGDASHARTETCSGVPQRSSAVASGVPTRERPLHLAVDAHRSEAWDLVVRLDAMEDPNVARIFVATHGDAMRVCLAPLLDDTSVGAGTMRIERGDQDIHAALAPVARGESAARPARRPRRNIRWTVLTRSRAEQVLELARMLTERGLRVGGFVQIPFGPASSKALGYDLYRFSRPERLPLAERDAQEELRLGGERHCELVFHPSTLARACEWLREDLATSDLLIVDGVGTLEERGRGFLPALAWARAKARVKMIILSSTHNRAARIARRLALPDRSVTEFSFDREPTAPACVVDHIVRACGRSGRGPRTARSAR